jgi:transposase InsO family protein
MLTLCSTSLALVHHRASRGAVTPGAGTREPAPAPPTHRPHSPHPNPTTYAVAHPDRLVWVLAGQFCAGWREHLAIVSPETVIRWHRQGWRLFWRWKSRSQGGRPHLSTEVRELIATISRENRLWGTERIRGELLKLGIVVSNRSIRRYRWRAPRRSPSHTWRTCLRNHAYHLWATDLFTVPTLTFKALYVLVFIAHGRRELVHLNVTANPTAAWVWRQMIEATPWGCKPRHLLRDRDAVYGRDFRQRAQRVGIDAIATPIHAPKANAVAERVIGTLRRECLDHPHRPGRAAPQIRADRIRRLLQPRSSASHAPLADSETETATSRGPDPVAADPERTAP